jgi:hypothetical protein
VKVAPLTSSVPVLAPPAFAATLNPMVALPVPLTLVLMVTHGTRLLAVQPQSARVVIAKVPEPPDEGIDAAAGCRDRVHAGAPGAGWGPAGTASAGGGGPWTTAS